MAVRWGDLHTHQPNLKSFIEFLTGFSRVYCPDDINTASLFQGYVFEAASGSRGDRQNPYYNDGMEVRNLWLLESSLYVNWQSLLKDVPSAESFATCKLMSNTSFIPLSQQQIENEIFKNAPFTIASKTM